MSEPLSGGGAVAVTIGGASVFGLLTNTDFGVVVARLPGRFLLSRSRKKSRYGEWLFTCSSRLWLAFWGLAWLRH